MNVTATPTECTCLNAYDHCPHCRAVEAAAKERPPDPPPSVPPPSPPSGNPPRPKRPKPDGPPPAQPSLIPAAEAARLCGMGARTLWRLVQQGRFPQPVRLSRKLVRWSRAAVLKWAKAMARKAST